MTETFTPWAPIDSLSLFRGRSTQLRSLVEAISQSGRHAIIYGDRGAGKSSIANVLHEALSWSASKSLMFVHVNCDFGDTFDSLWRKIFRELSVTEGNRVTNLQNKSLHMPRTLEQWLSNAISPEDIRRVLSLVDSRLVVIIDEYDQLIGNVETAHLMANTIKTLSDRRAPITLVLVGVADNIDQLIAEHESVERNLIQVHIPRMSDLEIAHIVNGGLAPLGMTVSADTFNLICLIALGLPSVAQLIGFHLASSAIENNRSFLEIQDLGIAIEAAIGAMPEGYSRNWQQAVGDVEFDSVSAKAMMSAALSRVDQFGWFGVQDEIDHFPALSEGPRMSIESYSQYLHSFATNRGPVLDRRKLSKGWRFRFKNPCFQPFVIMSGVASGLIDKSKLATLKTIDADVLAWDESVALVLEKDKTRSGNAASKCDLPQPELLQFCDTQPDSSSCIRDVTQNLSLHDVGDHIDYISPNQAGKFPLLMDRMAVPTPYSSVGRTARFLSTTPQLLLKMIQEHIPSEVVRSTILEVAYSVRKRLFQLSRSSAALRIEGNSAIKRVMTVTRFLGHERGRISKAITMKWIEIKQPSLSMVKPFFKDVLKLKSLISQRGRYKAPIDKADTT